MKFCLYLYIYLSIYIGDLLLINLFIYLLFSSHYLHFSLFPSRPHLLTFFLPFPYLLSLLFLPFSTFPILFPYSYCTFLPSFFSPSISNTFSSLPFVSSFFVLILPYFPIFSFSLLYILSLFLLPLSYPFLFSTTHYSSYSAFLVIPLLRCFPSLSLSFLSIILSSSTLSYPFISPHNTLFFLFFFYTHPSSFSTSVTCDLALTCWWSSWTPHPPRFWTWPGSRSQWG